MSLINSVQRAYSAAKFDSALDRAAVRRERAARCKPCHYKAAGMGVKRFQAAPPSRGSGGAPTM